MKTFSPTKLVIIIVVIIFEKVITINSALIWRGINLAVWPSFKFDGGGMGRTEHQYVCTHKQQVQSDQLQILMEETFEIITRVEFSAQLQV